MQKFRIPIYSNFSQIGKVQDISNKVNNVQNIQKICQNYENLNHLEKVYEKDRLFALERKQQQQNQSNNSISIYDHSYIDETEKLENRFSQAKRNIQEMKDRRKNTLKNKRKKSQDSMDSDLDLDDEKKDQKQNKEQSQDNQDQNKNSNIYLTKEIKQIPNVIFTQLGELNKKKREGVTNAQVLAEQQELQNQIINTEEKGELIQNNDSSYVDLQNQQLEMILEDPYLRKLYEKNPEMLFTKTILTTQTQTKVQKFISKLFPRGASLNSIKSSNTLLEIEKIKKILDKKNEKNYSQVDLHTENHIINESQILENKIKTKILEKDFWEKRLNRKKKLQQFKQKQKLIENDEEKIKYCMDQIYSPRKTQIQTDKKLPEIKQKSDGKNIFSAQTQKYQKSEFFLTDIKEENNNLPKENRFSEKNNHNNIEFTIKKRPQNLCRSRTQNQTIDVVKKEPAKTYDISQLYKRYNNLNKEFFYKTKMGKIKQICEDSKTLSENYFKIENKIKENIVSVENQIDKVIYNVKSDKMEFQENHKQEIEENCIMAEQIKNDIFQMSCIIQKQKRKFGGRNSLSPLNNRQRRINKNFPEPDNYHEYKSII